MKKRRALGLLAVLPLAAGIAVALTPERLFSGYPAASARLDAFLAEGAAHPFREDPLRTYAAIALVAQEDRRIYERALAGVSLPWDLRACARAALRNLYALGVEEGCSTLAMQLAKLALPPEARTRTTRAKLLQLRLAARAVGTPPDVIVSAYLRNLTCASPHARGLEACAALRFGRPLEELRPAEVMLLAAAVQAPGRDLQTSPESRARARARLSRVVASATELGFLDRDEAEALAAAPLEPAPPDLALLRALEAGQDPALARALSRAVKAARANALRKQGFETGDEEDLAVAGIAVDARGRVLAEAGPPAWLHRPLEAGSWVKPFVVEALLEAGLGPDYLSGEVEVPLRVPLVTRDGKRWQPRNAGELELERAPPMTHVMRSINTGTLASLLYAFVYLSPEKSRALLRAQLSPKEWARFSGPLDRRLSLEMASAYAGIPLRPEDAPDLPGYRQMSLGATRMVLGGMRARVPELEVPHEDLAALLGVVRAPAEALARGLAGVWLTPSGRLRPAARLMARHSPQGTLRWLGEARPAVYKTATADRNAGLAAVVFDRARGPYVVALVALRPSGEPITPVQGATLGPGYRAMLSEERSAYPQNEAVSMTYGFNQPTPERSGGHP